MGMGAAKAVGKFVVECEVAAPGSEAALLTNERKRTEELAEEVAGLRKQVELLMKINRPKNEGGSVER